MISCQLSGHSLPPGDRNGHVRLVYQKEHGDHSFPQSCLLPFVLVFPSLSRIWLQPYNSFSTVFVPSGSSKMSKIPVHFYYDLISPASWFGFELLTRYSQVWKSMDLVFKPFVLGIIMKESGNKPPMMVPNKGKYLFRDTKLMAKYCGIPFKLPENFPEQAFRTKEQMDQMRFVTAVDKLSSGEHTEALTRQFYLAIFNRHEQIGSIDFAETAKRANVPSPIIEKALEIKTSEEIKEKLRSNCNEALAQSAFGAPTIIAHLPTGPQLLWGCDRIELLAYLLNEKYQGPLLCHNKL